MTAFVWAKMQAEAGEPLANIIVRKEAERRTGGGLFWWGFGASLGEDVERAVLLNGPSLPVLFSRMLSPPKKKDSAPDEVWLWDGWTTRNDQGRIPMNILVTGGSPERAHYALVCQSSAPLRLQDHGYFDPDRCWTFKSRNNKGAEKVPGASQVTSLLWDRQPSRHKSGAYRFGFRADLIRPWTVKLANPRRLTKSEQMLVMNYHKGDDWMSLVHHLRK